MVLVIRQAQIEELSKAVECEFENRARLQLIKSWPSQTESMADTLVTFVKKGISDARSYGIKTETQIVRYLNMMIVWGERFDEIDWVKKILDKKISGLAKVHELSIQTKEQLAKDRPSKSN